VQGCFGNGAPGSPVYGNLDTQGGVLDPGRAVSATACLPQPPGAKASKKILWPGFDNSQMDRTHLLPRALGGSGSRRNIVPFGYQANQDTMTETEDQITEALNYGRVFYQAYPVYGSLDSTSDYQNIGNYEPQEIVIMWEPQGGPQSGLPQLAVIPDSVGDQPPRSR
ncbi:MAG: DNA/RNA non-specific endonuclease, partial [Candidatus Dormibacteraceae bacterium]